MTDADSLPPSVFDLPPGVPLARPVALPPPAPPTGPVHPLFLFDQSVKSAWADLALVAAMLLVFEFFVVSLIRSVVIEPPDRSPQALEAADAEFRRAVLVPFLSVRALCAVVVVALVVRLRRQSPQAVGVTRGRLGLDILVGFGALVAAYGLVFAVMPALWLLWPGVYGQMNENAKRIMEMVPRLKPLQFLPIAAMIGVYEELVFRGFLMVRLRRALGHWTPAVIASTFVFTLLHAVEQTPAALIVVTILSLVFSLVTIWRRSILPAVVAHALFDFSQFTFLYLVAGDSWK